jgi:hypothetical protein
MKGIYLCSAVFWFASSFVWLMVWRGDRSKRHRLLIVIGSAMIAAENVARWLR